MVACSKKMVEAKKAKLGVSCVAGAAYVAWVLCYVVKSGGEMWGGIATWVVWPHIICAALAALFGAAGITVRCGDVWNCRRAVSPISCFPDSAAAADGKLVSRHIAAGGSMTV